MSTPGGFADLGRILVIIPTYNEAENIEPIVARVRSSVPEAMVRVGRWGLAYRAKQLCGLLTGKKV